MGTVIAVSNNKGGVLKTSLTTNIAGVLAQQNKKVLIIDSDNQGNVAIAFGLNPDKYEETLYDVLVNGLDIKKIVVNVHKNIDVAISNDDMVNFELDILTNLKKYPEIFHLLSKKLSFIKDAYDFIFIDTPPNLGLTIGNVLVASDHVLIPFLPESFSLRSLQKILNQVFDFKNRYNDNLSVLGVVGTLVDNRTVLHSELLQETRKFCSENDIRLFETVIPRSVRFANSFAYERKPATLTDKKHVLVQTYFELVKEMNL